MHQPKGAAMTAQHLSRSLVPPRRVMVVIDWTTDAAAAVAAMRAHQDEHGPSRFTIVVPAWLHGLDWAGDPSATRPCAQRQADELGVLCHERAILLTASVVGDPDPTAAVCDALEQSLAQEILLLTQARHWVPRHPLDLAHRVRRATGLPVAFVPVPTRAQRDARVLSRREHCDASMPDAA